MRLEGRVVRGKQLGRTLGYPTANIEAEVSPAELPENGVYAAWFELDGRRLPCVLNQGRHPTVPEGPPTIEAHILDFTGDIYGRRVAVEYLRFLRPERRFPSLEALKAQIDADGRAARAYFAGLADQTREERP